MADSAALVAGITGASTVLAGLGAAYLTARQQLVASEQDLRSKREDAERDLREKALDKRLDTYVALLDELRDLRRLVAAGAAFDFADWMKTFIPKYDLLVLTATSATRTAAEDVYEEIRKIDKDRMDNPSADSFFEKFTAAFKDHDNELRSLQDALIEQMRRDVARHEMAERAAPAASYATGSTGSTS